MHNGRIMNLEEYPAHVERDRSARATAPELGEALPGRALVI
jgi:hypothetical protein